MRSKNPPFTFCVLLAVVIFAACNKPAERDGAARATVECTSGAVVEGRPLRIVTTVAPITSIVANLAGGTSTEITGLVPEGSNAHTFEPPPSAVRALAAADVVFVNGLKLDEQVTKLALANLSPGAAICELGTAILPSSEWIFDNSFPRDGGKPNPHLWTNPPMVAEYAKAIRNVLQVRDPAHRREYKLNYTAFNAKIDLLDQAVRDASNSIPREARKLLTYHDAYAYFALEYGWTVVGAIQPSSFDSPSPKSVVELIEQIRDEKVSAVFGSEVFPSAVLEQIGTEAGVRYIDVLRDDDLPGVPGEPEHSWLGMMRFNFVTLIEASGGDAAELRNLGTVDVAPDQATYPQ